MSEEDILQVAKDVKAGFPDSLYGRTDYCVMTKYELLAFARAIEAKAVEKEREGCAEVCDRIEIDKYNLYKGNDPYSKYSSGCNVEYVEGQSDGSSLCATAIRARGE